MIRVENLHYEINGLQLIKNLNVQFESRVLNLILGPNGSGKSTFIKLLSAELNASQGTVLYNNQPIKSLNSGQLAKTRAVLSQNLDLSFPMRVDDLVMMGRYPHFEINPSVVDKDICEQALKLFAAETFKHRNYLTLSGGEKQRVQFARVFAQIWPSESQEEKLLLLDEPLTFLDLYYQYDFMEKLNEFMKNHGHLTVVGVVHDINIADKYADKIMLIKQAELLDFGDKDKVLTESNIFEVFNVKVRDRFEVIPNNNPKKN
jgi:iron complex transport system ATP-binding protein